MLSRPPRVMLNRPRPCHAERSEASCLSAGRRLGVFVSMLLRPAFQARCALSALVMLSVSEASFLSAIRRLSVFLAQVLRPAQQALRGQGGFSGYPPLDPLAIPITPLTDQGLTALNPWEGYPDIDESTARQGRAHRAPLNMILSYRTYAFIRDFIEIDLMA